jgi:N-acyl-D-amino-acid deacylase
MHDTVIRGGTIVDGSGQPGFTGDVAMDNGKIAQVGQASARSTPSVC